MITTLIVTGIISIAFIFVTVYGQYAGNFLISLSKETSNKGIILSEEVFFLEPTSILKIKSVDLMEDILASFDIEKIENTNGQYFENETGSQNYIAYTFYIKNTGTEVVNLNYIILTYDDYKDLAMGTAVWIKRSKVNEDYSLSEINETLYSKAYTNESVITNETIASFKPNDIYKFTLLIWLNGEGEGITTTPEMMGGALKLEWSFKISE